MVMEMKRIVNKLCICIFIPLFLAGCGDYRELNKLSFVIAMGIDRTNDKENPYEVTLQIVNPSEVTGGGGTAPTGKALTVINTVEKGSNIVDAIRKASNTVSRPLFFGHTSLVVLNEEAAQDGIHKVLDQFARSPQASIDTPVLIARETTAQTLLSDVSALEKIPALSNIQKLQYSQDILGEEFSTSIQEIIEDTTLYGREIAVTGITLPNIDEKVPTQENALQIKPPVTKIKGVGLFRNDDLVGWLDEEDGLAAGIALQKAKATNIDVPCGEDSFSLSLTNIKSSLQTEIEDGEAILTLQVNGRGSVDETTCQDILYQQPKDIIQTEKKAIKKLKKQLEKGIREAQKKESDIFGFGEAYRNKHPKKWKKIKDQWPAYFGKAEVRVKVKISVARTNMQNAPIRPVYPKGEKD